MTFNVLRRVMETLARKADDGTFQNLTAPAFRYAWLSG
jgi:hypothetical protein